MRGLELENLGIGALFVLAATVINALLGWYLVRTGRRHNSLILEANGLHVLTDSGTSLGVASGLGLVLWTGWKPFDPLFAIAVALDILCSGGRLVWRSIGGLMDYLEYHCVRFRNAGQRLMVEVHLLFPRETPVGEAHRQATALENELSACLSIPVDIVTHLESLEDHARVHRGEHYTGKPA
ncbi:MAG: hypothetical protein EXQ52_06560 [Bryobacterales bacterium]|nr:hypothetical protein [Bryobacterales bacterium]